MCAICRKNHFPEKNLILQRKNTIRFAVTVAVTSIRALVCVLAVVINKMNRTTSGFVYIKEKICGAENESILIKIPFQPAAFAVMFYSAGEAQPSWQSGSLTGKQRRRCTSRRQSITGDLALASLERNCSRPEMPRRMS